MTRLYFIPQGPETATGDRPIVLGLVASTPIPEQTTTYRIKLDDNTYADVSPDDLIRPEECEYDIEDLLEKDPTDGDPIHPERPPWLVTGQPVAYYQSGQRLLGYLDLDSGFRWAFVQYDNRGTCVTEIALPNIAVNWRHLLDKKLLEIGHNTDSSPFITATSKDPTVGAETITRGTLRSGKHFRGHSRHVSATTSRIHAHNSFGNLYLIQNHRTMIRGLPLTRKNMTVSMLWTLTTKLMRLSTNG
jgi:hypothetical protein